ncbi:DUF317 domain-containing protein [Streptomyces sp. NPDC050085]|uniref:DUF317 domain-containing protein n=1 Tax=Streptomyces sp. NPDC050085 TaxID=3365600 RepID=UPI0037BDAF8B
MVLVSPDHRYTLALEPSPDAYATWWRIVSHADGSHWYAAFGGNTPVEVIAGFTDALLRPHPTTPSSPWPLLRKAGGSTSATSAATRAAGIRTAVCAWNGAPRSATTSTGRPK